MLARTPERRRPGHIPRQNPGPSLLARVKTRLPCLYASAARRCPVLWMARLKASESYRLYSCVRCVAQVRICRSCDRGNRYCAVDCAAIRRRESLRGAGRRYQRSPRGARCHAARQRAWRTRVAQKVTHQGSARVDAPGTMMAIATLSAMRANHVDIPGEALPNDPAVVLRIPAIQIGTPALRCSFCCRLLPRFARLGRLRGGP